MKKNITLLLLASIFLKVHAANILEVKYPRSIQEDEYLKYTEEADKWQEVYNRNPQDFLEIFTTLDPNVLAILEQRRTNPSDFVSVSDFTINKNDIQQLKVFDFSESTELHNALQLIIPHKKARRKNTLPIQYLIADPNHHKSTIEINWEEIKNNIQKNSYFKTRPALSKLTIIALELLNQGILTNIHFGQESLFSACPCIEAPERIFMAIITAIKTIQSIQKDQPITYISLGSGYLLQDYVILKMLKLFELNIDHIILIDHEHHQHLIHKLTALLEFPNQNIMHFSSIRGMLQRFHNHNSSFTYLLILSDPDTTPNIFNVMMQDFEILTESIPKQTTVIKSIMYNNENKDLVTFNLQSYAAEGPQNTSFEKHSKYDTPIDPQIKAPSQSLDLKPMHEIKELFEQYKRSEITLEDILEREDQVNQIRIQTIFKRLGKN